jgi:hypothetical protein
MLSIGAAMLGAQHVLGVDLDDDALRIAQQNVGEYEEALPVGQGTASCILYDAADRCTGWLGLLPAVCANTANDFMFADRLCSVRCAASGAARAAEG